RLRETGDGRAGGEGVEEIIGIHLGDLVDVEPTQSLGQFRRSRERALHGHLLIKKHPAEQSETVFCQQCVGLRISGEDHSTHSPILARNLRSFISGYLRWMICPCSGMPSVADSDHCCRPALDGEVWPTTAEARIRSLYTA